jgi:hypothetical protein
MNQEQRESLAPNQLWQGAILVSIAYAISYAESAILAHECSWDGLNYNRQDSQGTRGTLAFGNQGVVGLVRDDRSPAAPWHREDAYDVDAFLQGLPPDLSELAHEASQYLLDEYNDRVQPIITAAFWYQGDALVGAATWPELYAHGAHLFRIECMQHETALLECQADFELSDDQFALLKSLFERRINASSLPIKLEDWQYEMLVSKAADGLAESLELLETIGIVVE